MNEETLFSLEKTVPEVPSGEGPAAPPARIPSLAGNVAWRAAANAVSQFVSWASLLVVVRLLSPADFGIVSMCVVFYSQLRFLGEFGLPTTIVTLRDLSDEAIAQLNTAGLMLGMVAFVLGCIIARPVAWFFKTTQLVPVMIVTSLSLVALGARSVPEGLLNKEIRLKSLSLFDAIRDTLCALFTVTLAYLGFGYWSLVLGNLLSIVLRCGIILSIRRHRFAWPQMSVIKAPLTFSWHVLVSVFAWSTYNTLDNVTAGRVLGKASLGLYAMAWNLANMPLEKVVSLVTTIIPTYLAAVQKDPPALRRYVRTLTESVALATFPATMGLALVARELVPFALGRKWDGMILPLQILCMYTAFRSLVALLPKVLTAIGKARFVMRVEVSALILMGVSFYIGSHWGITGIAWAWVAAYPFVAVPLYWNTLKSVDMRVSEYFAALRPALDGSAAMIVAVEALKHTLFSPTQPLLPRLVAEIAVGMFVYLGTIFLLHRERAMTFLNLLKRVRRPKLSSSTTS